MRLDFIKKYTLLFLRFIVGFVFIFSGIAKLFPIELFEFDIVEYGITSWALAPYFSRLLIAFEIFLGLALIANWQYKRIVFPASFILLLFFTIFLAYRWMIYGNSSNCGCFGTWLPMSISQSLIKNGLLLIVLVLIYFYSDTNFTFRKEKIIIPVLYVCILSAVMAFRLPEDFYLTEEKPPLENNTINPAVFPPIINNGDTLKPDINASFLVFLSLTCPHCINTARKLSIINKRVPELKFLVYLNGERKYLPLFLSETKLSLPYTLFNKRDFILICQGSVPKLFFTKNFKIVAYWTGEDFTEDELVDYWKGNKK
jgi:uncharacterized membrane protein YphA (DoxX/SURF4 family)